MAAQDDSFFSRWSRRKRAQRSGDAPLAEPARAPETPVLPPLAAASTAPAALSGAPEQPPAEPKAPPPTMDDVALLTPEADFSRFVAPEVSSEVRNAAVKKLFADPRFNVMDGLDTYIEDYSLPSPLSKADLAMMVGARFLKLVDDPDEKKPASADPPPGATPDAHAPLPEAPSGGPTAADTPAPHDDHADLQLQPDHEPGRESPGPGAG